MSAHRSNKAILLDFDGTYADTAPDMIAALNHLCLAYKRDPIDPDFARPYVSYGSRALIELGFTDWSAVRKQALIPEFLNSYEQVAANDTQVFAGLGEYLQPLAEQNIAWGIVTNKPAYLTEIVLREIPQVAQPQCVVSGDSLLKRKPHPMPVLHAAALLKTPAHRCVYVGDSRYDIAAGNAAGMYTVAATYGYILPQETPHSWGADAEAASIKALTKALDHWLQQT